MMTELQDKNDNSVSKKHLTGVQLNNLLQYVSNEADLARQTGATRAIVDELIIFLLINAGLKPAELCSLNIEDLPSSHGKNAVWVRDSKGAVTRAIDVSSSLTERVGKFVRLFRNNAEPGEPLLVNERGNRFTYRSLYSKVKNIGVNAGIGPLYPNMLRSTFIVRLYDDVKDLRWVQQQAGHQSPKSTAVYAGKTFNRKRKTKANPMPQKDAHKPGQVKLKSFKCDGCGKLMNEEGRKIDSGHILCYDCFKSFQ